MSSPTGTTKPSSGSKGEEEGSKKGRRVKAQANTEPKSTVTIAVEPATEETSATQVADKDVAADTSRNEDEEAKGGTTEIPKVDANESGQEQEPICNMKQEDPSEEMPEEDTDKPIKHILDPTGNVKEEEHTKEMPEVSDMPDKHILYPGGGHFNKLRKKQVFLNELLESCVDKYIDARNKREFVKEEILVKLPGGLHVYDKDTGDLYQPDELEAFERVAQKLRDIKKFRLNSIKRATSGTEGKPGRKSKKATAANAAAEERKRKRDEELERQGGVIATLEAEIAALRKDNSEQKEELDKLKELFGVNQADKHQRIEEQASPEKDDSKTSEDQPEPERETVQV